MTGAAFLDADTFIGAETGFNLFTCRVCVAGPALCLMVRQRVFDAADESAALRMETTGEFHLGHYVNALRHGASSHTLHAGI